MNIFLPPIVLRHEYYLGDTILLEPIARQLHEFYNTDVYIQSNYSELLENHPSVKGIKLHDRVPNARVIDMNRSIASIRDNQFDANKIQNMCKECGITQGIDAPKLFLSQDEQKIRYILSNMLPSPRIGVCYKSRSKIKNYPYINSLIRCLIKYFNNVYVFSESLSDDESKILSYGITPIIGKPLREVMVWASIMDVMIGPDTGILHLAGSLGVPQIIIAYDMVKKLYSIYDNAIMLTGIGNTAFSLYTIPIKRVLHAVSNVLETKYNEHKETTIKRPHIAKGHKLALFRLDGLGGTVTLTDHAKKIFESTGIKPVLVVRNYRDLFKHHPYISDIIEVGYVKWEEALNEAIEEFDIVGEIRFALGKWHQRTTKLFSQDFTEFEELFRDFPHNYRTLEKYNMHHIQITDMTFGLDYDAIVSEIYNYEPTNKFSLPKDYLVVNNGIDTMYNGRRQTKMWNGFDEVIRKIDLATVQVGSQYDALIDGVDYDLRGKTTIGELASLLRDSRLVLCCEGGIMHLSYAVSAKNVLIIRGPTRGKLFEYQGHKFVDSYVCDNCWSTTPDWYLNCPKKINCACMETITPIRVLVNIEGILNECMA